MGGGAVDMGVDAVGQVVIEPSVEAVDALRRRGGVVGVNGTVAADLDAARARPGAMNEGGQHAVPSEVEIGEHAVVDAAAEGRRR